MNKSQLSQVINPALKRFFKRDSHLLEYDVSELAITHKLAIYVERRLRKRVKRWGVSTPKYVVDCEFNREGDDVKRLPFTHYLSDEREQLYAPCPDIIIHERGTNDHNAVVIEVKKMNQYFHPFLRALDLLKLACFVQPPLHYEFGIFFMFDTDKDKCNCVEALSLTSANTDDTSLKCLRDDLQNIWTEIRAAGINRVPRTLQKLAIDLADSIEFEDILDKSSRQLTSLS